MRVALSMSLAGALLIVAGCVPTPPSSPTPVARNSDWTPQTALFDGVPMVRVPTGCFSMGSDEMRRDTRPAHPVCVTAYWLDQFEVTNAAYGSVGRFAGDDRPRENLTWAEARDHCTARGARLPSEAEWEWAARGPDGLLYPWGNTLDAAWLVFDQNSNNETAPVGLAVRADGASWVGAHDLAGNVWEWTNSRYAPYPYNAADGREDASDAPEVPRVMRGGVNSYQDHAASAVWRFSAAPGARDWYVGFRCARDGLVASPHLTPLPPSPLGEGGKRKKMIGEGALSQVREGGGRPPSPPGLLSQVSRGESERR